jgi:hypothetical protein
MTERLVDSGRRGRLEGVVAKRLDEPYKPGELAQSVRDRRTCSGALSAGNGTDDW